LPLSGESLQPEVFSQWSKWAQAAQHAGRAPDTHPSSGKKTATADWPEQDAPQMPAPITLRQRAWPLMDMLRTAQAKGKDVTWGV